MDISNAVVKPFITKVLDWVVTWWGARDLPLREEAVLFHPPTASFYMIVENKTAQSISLDSLKLRAFDRDSIFAWSRQSRTWYQPLEVDLHPVSNEGVEEAFGLEDGSVPAYSQAHFGITHENIIDRIVDADRLEFVAINEGEPVLQTSTGTGWIRDSLREAIQDGRIELED